MINISPYTKRICIVYLVLFLVPLTNAFPQAVNEGHILAEGWHAFNTGDLDRAKALFLSIQTSDDRHIRFDSLFGLGYTRLKQGQVQAAQDIFSTLVSQRYNLTKTLPALLQSLGEDSEQRYDIALKILKLNPKDGFALSVAAWHHYHRNQYLQAQTYFTRLLKTAPDDAGAVIGLGYSLMHQGQHKNALQLIEQPFLKENEQVLELKQILLSKMIQEELDNNNLPQALSLWKKIVTMQSLYPPVSHAASRLIDTLMKKGDTTAAWHLAEQMAKSKDNALKDAAASFYFTQNAPILASQTMNSPGTCYYNALSPRIEGFAYHAHRSGDPGTSQLDENILPVSFVLPMESGQEWRMSWVFKHMDSGTPKATRAGSYYLNVNGDRPPSFLGNTADVHQLFLSWRKEGRRPFRLQIGTSPINSDVGLTPVVNLQTRISDFRVEVHRESIEESILSYAGLKDPYGRSAWGRVTRNGGIIGRSFDLNAGRWFSADAGFDFFRGENIEDNYSWALDFAMGQTKTWKKRWEVTWGGYASYKHFDKNSNFFSYGHGGYYSPDYILSAGPLFRFKSAECNDFGLDIQISLGWMFEKTKDNAYYPLNEVPTSLSPAALNELNGRYSGESNNGPTASIQVEGWKMLTEHIIVGAFGAFNHSTEYDEWRLGLRVSFSLEPLTAFWEKKPFQTQYQLR